MAILLRRNIYSDLEWYENVPPVDIIEGQVRKFVNNEIDVLLSNSRNGQWFFCIARNLSGWINEFDLEPLQLPSFFILNDTLPADTRIRTRAQPLATANELSQLSPGTIIFVKEIQDQWLRINYHNRDEWLLRRAGKTPLAFPYIPQFYSKNATLPTDASLRIRSNASSNGEVLKVTTNSYFMGIEEENINPSWIRMVALPEQEGFMMTETQGTILLRLIPETKISLMCLSSTLPNNAEIRLREEPLDNSTVLSLVKYNEILCTVAKKDIWVRVLCHGRDGWIKSEAQGMSLLEKYTIIKPSEFQKPSKNQNLDIDSVVTTANNNNNTTMSPNQIPINDHSNSNGNSKKTYPNSKNSDEEKPIIEINSFSLDTTIKDDDDDRPIQGMKVGMKDITNTATPYYNNEDDRPIKPASSIPSNTFSANDEYPPSDSSLSPSKKSFLKSKTKSKSVNNNNNVMSDDSILTPSSPVTTTTTATISSVQDDDRPIKGMKAEETNADNNDNDIDNSNNAATNYYSNEDDRPIKPATSSIYTFNPDDEFPPAENGDEIPKKIVKKFPFKKSSGKNKTATSAETTDSTDNTTTISTSAISSVQDDDRPIKGIKAEETNADNNDNAATNIYNNEDDRPIKPATSSIYTFNPDDEFPPAENGDEIPKKTVKKLPFKKSSGKNKTATSAETTDLTDSATTAITPTTTTTTATISSVQDDDRPIKGMKAEETNADNNNDITNTATNYYSNEDDRPIKPATSSIYTFNPDDEFPPAENGEEIPKKIVKKLPFKKSGGINKTATSAETTDSTDNTTTAITPTPTTATATISAIQDDDRPIKGIKVEETNADNSNNAATNYYSNEDDRPIKPATSSIYTFNPDDEFPPVENGEEIPKKTVKKFPFKKKGTKATVNNSDDITTTHTTTEINTTNDINVMQEDDRPIKGIQAEVNGNASKIIDHHDNSSSSLSLSSPSRSLPLSKDGNYSTSAIPITLSIPSTVTASTTVDPHPHPVITKDHNNLLSVNTESRDISRSSSITTDRYDDIITAVLGISSPSAFRFSSVDDEGNSPNRFSAFPSSEQDQEDVIPEICENEIKDLSTDMSNELYDDDGGEQWTTVPDRMNHTAEDRKEGTDETEEGYDQHQHPVESNYYDGVEVEEMQQQQQQQQQQQYNYYTTDEPLQQSAEHYQHDSDSNGYGYQDTEGFEEGITNTNIIDDDDEDDNRTMIEVEIEDEDEEEQEYSSDLDYQDALDVPPSSELQLPPSTITMSILHKILDEHIDEEFLTLFTYEDDPHSNNNPYGNSHEVWYTFDDTDLRDLKRILSGNTTASKSPSRIPKKCSEVAILSNILKDNNNNGNTTDPNYHDSSNNNSNSNKRLASSPSNDLDNEVELAFDNVDRKYLMASRTAQSPPMNSAFTRMDQSSSITTRPVSTPSSSASSLKARTAKLDAEVREVMSALSPLTLGLLDPSSPNGVVSTHTASRMIRYDSSSPTAAGVAVAGGSTSGTPSRHNIVTSMDSLRKSLPAPAPLRINSQLKQQSDEIKAKLENNDIRGSSGKSNSRNANNSPYKDSESLLAHVDAIISPNSSFNLKQSNYDSDDEYDSLKDLLQQSKLTKYFTIFRENEVTLDVLHSMSDIELSSMGLAIGAIKKLRLAVGSE